MRSGSSTPFERSPAQHHESSTLQVVQMFFLVARFISKKAKQNKLGAGCMYDIAADVHEFFKSKC